MQYQLYSQLLRLDLSNDHLLQMYYVLYYDLKEEEEPLAVSIARLIEIREKIKLELRRHLFNIKNSIKETTLTGAIMEYLPVFLKLSHLAKNTFNTPNLELCYQKERRNIKLYYETLYNQNLTTDIVDVLLKQKRNLESSPE